MNAKAKYLELQVKGIPRPTCACHHEIMYWTKKNTPAGGEWRCKIKSLDAVRRYHERKRAQAGSSPGSDSAGSELVRVELPGRPGVVIRCSAATLPDVLASITD